MKCARARNIKDRDPGRAFRGFHYHEIISIASFVARSPFAIASPINGAAIRSIDRETNIIKWHATRERYSRGGDRPRECGWHIRMEMQPALIYSMCHCTRVAKRIFITIPHPASQNGARGGGEEKKYISYIYNDNYIYVSRARLFSGDLHRNFGNAKKDIQPWKTRAAFPKRL